MGRKLNLSHLSEEECERILHVLQKDFEVRQIEKERIGAIQNTLKSEENKTYVLSQQSKFNKNCCIRCCQVFGLIFNRRRQCFHCGYNVCKDCCSYQPDSKHYVCNACEKQKDLSKQSCSWFYTSVGQKFRRFGSAKVVRSLYKTTSYCKLRHAISTQGGLNNNKLIIITNKDNNNNNDNKDRRANSSDTELDRGYTGSGQSRSVQVTSRRTPRPRLPAAFRDDTGDAGDEDKEEGDDSDELPPPSPNATSRPTSTITRSLGSHPVARAGSVDTLNLLSSASPSSKRHHRTRTPDPSKPLRASDLGKRRTPDPGSGKGRARWDDGGGGSKAKSQNETKENIYKHAFESARQAEEHKFKAKFDLLLNDLHRTLDTQSPKGLTDSFASTSYGEVMLSFRGRVKDLLVGFTQRLQLAYESFDSSDSPEDHSQQVKQNVSRFLEDLLGESLDLTSDEAVSDLSSLSDDSGNDRHAFEDQIAQAVVSKILDSHRREVHHTLYQDRRSRHRSGSSLVPEALLDNDEENGNNNDDDDDRRSPAADNADIRDTDISKDFEDLRNFVQETQSRSRQFEENSCDSVGGVGIGESRDSSEARVGSSFDTHSTERDFPPLPDFSQFDQINFNSGEVDPDLVQMNLAVIPEETDEQLEEEDAADTHWRENWIFKGQAPSAYDNCDRKRIRGDSDHPQYMMVPRPDDDLAPKIGNRDVNQLSDLSDNEVLTDDDDASFYPSTSEELARISKHKRSLTPPSLSSPSLIPSTTEPYDNHDASLLTEDSLLPKKQARRHSSKHSDMEVDVEDVGVGTEDLVVGPIVEKTRKELKLLEDLVPAEGDDPKFVVPPESVTIQEGEPVRLSCRVAGTQPIDVFWYRESDKVEELEEGEDVDLHLEGDRHQATLYNLGHQRAGQYMCIALSDAGKAIKYFTLTVNDNRQELKKPEFLKELKDVEVLEGQSIKFRCKVKGYPQPRINWYKDGKLLKSNRLCRIEKFGNRDYILTVDYATMDDDAEYMVVAKNVAGEVRSTAQVIVEPYAEGHPLLLKSRSQSMSTIYTDTESDRPSSVFLEDFMAQPLSSATRDNNTRRWSEDNQVDSLVNQVTAARDHMRQEAESMIVTADELNALTDHLEDMERHLDSLEGHNSASASNAYRKKPTTNHSDYFPDVSDDAAIEMITNARAMGDAARSVRKLTSNALSVLRAAEEIIQSERSMAGLSSSPTHSGNEVSSSSHPSEENNNKSVSLESAMDQSSLTTHSDLNQSVSSGYGTISMASSAMDENGNDDTIAESSLSHLDLPEQDEFDFYLPPLDDETSGSYREEVSISLSSSKPNRTQKQQPGGASSSSSSTVTPSSASSSSSSSGRTVQPQKPTSSMNTSVDSDLSDLWPHRQSVSSAVKMEAPADELDSSLAMATLPSEEESLILNFGPKEISATAYNRDYEVAGASKEVDVSEKKHWSVTLDPYVPTAEVVNRQPSLEETEEQIYLTAGKMFSLEDRVKELQARVRAEDHTGSVHTLSHLEDQVAKTAASVARSEKDVSNIERAVNTLQFSPRSSVRSSSSANSTPRESIDSGVSSFTPERQERPLPVHMIGQTQEEEMPESRAEYDDDSGIELPSVTRLRAMFGSRGKEDEAGEGNFKRIHSITARSLTKEQLQKLREAGNTTLSDIIRLKEQPAHIKTTSSSLSVNLSPVQQQQQQQPAIKRQIQTPKLLEPAQYRELDPSKQPVLIYPEMEEETSASATPAASPRSLSVATSRLESAVSDTDRLVGATRAAALSTPRAMSAEASESQELVSTPKIRSGCISARAAFWERRIMQGEATDVEVEEEFPEMVQDSQA